MSNRLGRPPGRNAAGGGSANRRTPRATRANEPRNEPHGESSDAPSASRGHSPAGASSPPYRTGNRSGSRSGTRARRRRNPTAEILTVSILVSLLVLFGVGLMWWGVESRLLFSPTPTPTATPRTPPTSTPDIRATHVAQDMATQIAMLIALQTRTPGIEIPPIDTPTPSNGNDEPGDHSAANDEDNNETEDPTISLPAVGDGSTDEAETGEELEATPTIPPQRTPITVSMPAIEGDQPTPTPDPLAIPTETPTPTATPTQIPTETPTPTEIPTEIPTELPTETPTPTETPVPPPVETPTPTPTSTPPVFTVASLRATIRNADTTARVGPSNIYADTGVFGAGAGINLLGRNPSGEWVYACCTTGGQPAWVRQAFAVPSGNDLGPDAPEGANPNDVRWLGIQALPSNVEPVPAPTAIPPGDYPYFRYNRANQARPQSVPRPPISFGWPSGAAQAGAGFISPAIVVGNGVLAASADNHLYSFDRTNGAQRWRFNIGRPLRMAPTVLDSTLYVATEDGLALALVDQSNQAAEIWRTNLPDTPVTSFTIHQNALYIGVGRPDNYQLVTLDRGNGAVLRSLPVGGPSFPHPAIGDQLIYIGGNPLTALDATLSPANNAYETVWTRGDINGITTPPLYSSNGVRALTELYVVDANHRIHSLDAQTGRELWAVENGEPATGLALNQGALFVSGNNYVKSISRENGAQLWRATVQGQVLGGPIVNDEFIVIATQVGVVQFLSAVSGNTVGGSSILSNAAAAPAVSSPYIYVPGVDGRLYALQGNP